MAAEILTGRDALNTVANPKGHWNWALVGADPEALPLAGGGSGSIDEMRECLIHQEKSAVLFGLLRLSFGTGRVRVHRNVFIVASGVDEAFASGQKSSMVTRGKAMNKRPAMEKALDAIAHTHAKIIVSSKEDLSVEAIVQNLQGKTTADADLVTVENFHLALKDFQESLTGETKPKASTPKSPSAKKDEAKKEVEEEEEGRPVRKRSSCVAAPPAEVQEEKPKLDGDEEEELPVRKRSSCVAAPPAEVQEEQPKLDGDEALPGDVRRSDTFHSVVDKEDKEEATSAEAPAEAAPAAVKPAEPADTKPTPELSPVVSSAGYPNSGTAAAPVAPVAAAAPAGGKKASQGIPAAQIIAGYFAQGELVEVFSASSGKWHDDGLVLQVLEAPDVQDGISLPGGSVKIQYQNDQRLKWVPPIHLANTLRKSERPRPPKALTGELLKETHNWVAEWHVRYFQLKRGWLQWWVTRQDAVDGIKPNGALDLTGLAVGSSGTVFSMRTANSKGVVYNFDARNHDDVEIWKKSLKEHTLYIDKMKSLMESRNDADYA